ncbi:hypothetical protein JCM6882_009489 [Rhodosporidiobolus microsporus]
MSEPAPPSPPRRTINDLPTELKQRIVELCAEQDAVYREWMSSVREALEIDEETMQGLDELDKLHGRTLKALFGTSRQWSALAAPLLFRTLRASRADSTWQFYVALSRLPHFTHLVLDGDSREQLLDVMSRIPLLPQLNELTITLQAWAVLLDRRRDLHPNVWRSDRHIVLAVRAAAAKAEVLHGVDLGGFEWSVILEACGSRLRTVDLVVTEIANLNMESDARLLVRALKALPSLEELGINVRRSAKGLPDLLHLVDAFTPDGADEPLPLRALSYNAKVLTESAVEFCEVFRSTLRQLRLTCYIEGEEEDSELEEYEPPDFTEEFPNVHTLSVNGNAYLQAPLTSMSSELFPSLQHLDFALLNYTPNSVLDFPMPLLLSHARTLRKLSYRHLGHTNPGGASLVEDFARQHGIRLSRLRDGVFPSLPSFWGEQHTRYQVKRYGGKAGAHCRQLVVDAQKFLTDRLADLQARDDPVAMARLASALQGLDLEMQAHRS